jgi:hypothetical protein
MTDPEELKKSKAEQDRNSKVTALSKTESYKEEAEEKKRLKLDDNGKARPIIQRRKIQIAKKGSGKKTRIFGEDGKVLYEATPGTAKEREMLRRHRNQEANTNNSRQKNADVMNYQTGDEKGNRVYEERIAIQKRRDAN